METLYKLVFPDYLCFLPHKLYCRAWHGFEFSRRKKKTYTERTIEQYRFCKGVKEAGILALSQAASFYPPPFLICLFQHITHFYPYSLSDS